MSDVVQIEREFLMSKLTVPNEKSAKFREQVSKTLPIFEQGQTGVVKQPSLRWRLAVSGVSDKKNGRSEFLHIWKTPKAWSLYTAMNYLATDRDYAGLHDCVEDEEQHLLGTENMYSPTSLIAFTARTLVVESFKLPPDRVAVARLQFGMKLLAQKMLKEHNWRLLLALQHQTGKLGTRVHVWGVGTGQQGEDVARLVQEGKRTLCGSELHQATKLLNERRNKEPQHCKLDARFEEYDVVDYRS